MLTVLLEHKLENRDTLPGGKNFDDPPYCFSTGFYFLLLAGCRSRITAFALPPKGSNGHGRTRNEEYCDHRR